MTEEAFDIPKRPFSRPSPKKVAGGAASVSRYSQAEYPLNELTQEIIGCAIAVHRALGPGYLERIYEKALMVEFAKKGLRCEHQCACKVLYDGVEVGEHCADMVVEGKVVLELKCVEALNSTHVAQTISTLKAMGLEVGLLMNFNEAVLMNGVRRVVLTSK